MYTHNNNISLPISEVHSQLQYSPVFNTTNETAYQLTWS